MTGPIVLQIQKVKNVAVPSTKQHNPSSAKRLMRLQLTDGKVSISAVETEGAIDKLKCVIICCFVCLFALLSLRFIGYSFYSPATPPGTKVKLKGIASVVNGFFLLTRSSTEILGGQVESLLSKWRLSKVCL